MNIVNRGFKTNLLRAFSSIPTGYHARVQFPAPYFEAISYSDDAFRKVSLDDYKGRYLVFFTYPLDFTFVCPTEIIEFNDKAKDFKKISTNISLNLFYRL